MQAKKKPGRKPMRGPAIVTTATLPPSPELLALQALPAEKLLKLYEHLQAFVLERRQLLPPLARVGAAAGLTRAQAQVLLTGTGNRTARTAERLHALHQVLKPHNYEPIPHIFL
jgi:hypothetical protein